MTRYPPVIVVVAAIINMLVGLAGVGVGLLGLYLFFSLLRDGRFASLIMVMNQAIPGWLYLEVMHAALILGLGVGLIIASACLFLLQPWARWYCLLYGVFAIFLHIGCEPTVHRLVQRLFLPPPHHPLECRREPTAAAWFGVG